MTETASSTLPDEAAAGAGRSGAGLLSASFLGLLITQLLGAVNDNMFRWLVVGIGKEYLPERPSMVLSAGLACFVTPYLLLAAPAGYLADRFSKRTVIVNCKVAEFVILSLGLMAIWLGGRPAVFLLLIVMFLLGCQAALFSPSKLGCIPELVRRDRISAANGLVGLTTVIATVVGAAAGNYLYDFTQPKGQHRLWAAVAALLGVSVVGWLTSLWIRPLAPANPSLEPPRNLVRRTFAELRTLFEHGALFRAALGIAFFWSLGSMAQMNIDQFGIEGQSGVAAHLQQKGIVPLLVSLVVGVGLGSVLAGVWSGGRVELGILPVGAAGIAASSMLLFTVQGQLITPAEAHTAAFTWACVLLFMLGISAGLFDIPLAAFMQYRSPPESLGAILAASNFLTFAGMLLFSGIYALLRAPLGGAPLLSARHVFLVCGLGTLPVLGYIVWLLPRDSLRIVFRLAAGLFYRIRIRGRENIPLDRGALLVSNHVTWLDGFFLQIVFERPVRMMADEQWLRRRPFKWLSQVAGTIPLRPGRKALADAIRTARGALEAGELVCIFPEGGITRSGQLRPFKPGFLAVAKGTAAPVIPVFLDELWGSIFSFAGGRFFWKRPRRWRYPVSIWFGPPLFEPREAELVQRAVGELGVRAVEQRKTRSRILPRLFLRMCRRNLRRAKVADTLGTELTGGKLLAGGLVFRRLLRREVLAADEKYVGILLPPSAGAVLSNVALALDGRVAVNLNYTLTPEVMNSCVRQCGIRHVLTSRRFLERFEFRFDVETVFLEELRRKATAADKLVAAVQAYGLPAAVLERLLGLTRIGVDDVLTVIFTSGSTGEPKGVMLTHRNVGSNIEAIDQLVKLSNDDVVLGILPFFHSFGYTTTMWTVLTMPPKGAYHVSPLEARQIGELCRKHSVTIIISTPTFLRSYLKRCQPEEFAALDVVLAGAEKLPKELCDAFEEKFGVRPVEGYGCTELSPLVSVNIPASRAASSTQVLAKEGTVGRPIPGVVARIVDVDSGRELGVDQPGMLWIKGPNVMLGYLGHPEKTAQVIRDGWYETGDIAVIDADGFIRITGRESRFSKIGGEMVPHIKIEETLQKVIGAGEDELTVAVTAVPDARKGERIVVLHTEISKPPEQIIKELAAAGLPNLWIPSPDSFHKVEAIPVLGTGKVDLRGLKNLALKEFAGN